MSTESESWGGGWGHNGGSKGGGGGAPANGLLPGDASLAPSHAPRSAGTKRTVATEADDGGFYVQLRGTGCDGRRGAPVLADPDSDDEVEDVTHELPERFKLLKHIVFLGNPCKQLGGSGHGMVMLLSKVGITVTHRVKHSTTTLFVCEGAKRGCGKEAVFDALDKPEKQKISEKALVKQLVQVARGWGQRGEELLAQLQIGTPRGGGSAAGAAGSAGAAGAEPLGAAGKKRRFSAPAAPAPPAAAAPPPPGGAQQTRAPRRACQAYAAYVNEHGTFRCGHKLEVCYNAHQQVWYIKCVAGCHGSITAAQAQHWLNGG